MLIKTLKVIALLATAITLIGCSANRATSAAPSVVRSEQETLTPDKRPSTAVKQTQAAAYRPCIQGPETLRFLDRVTAEKPTLEGDEVRQLVNRLPPLTRQRFMRSLELNIEDFTKHGQGAVIRTYEGAPLSTDIAEEYIADCSDQLARLLAATVIPDNWPAEAVVRLWQSNLEFMKWWLANHRQKTRNMR